MHAPIRLWNGTLMPYDGDTCAWLHDKSRVGIDIYAGLNDAVATGEGLIYDLVPGWESTGGFDISFRGLLRSQWSRFSNGLP